VRSRDIALCNGKVACEPCLARHNVVVALRRCGLFKVETDIKKLAVLVKQHREIHRPYELLHTLGKLRAVIRHKPVFERQQAGIEVAAVDGGDILRLQTAQRPRVVPVAQMPRKFRHFLKRREHFFDKLKCPACLVDAEINGAQSRHERKADIRRRGAVRKPHRRLLLIIIRRQEVVLGGAEPVKIRPNTLGTLQKILLFVRRKLPHGLCRKRQRKRRQGCDYPQKPDRFCKNTGRENDERKTRHGCCPHIEVIRTNTAFFALTLSGGLPFKQILAAYAHAPERDYCGT